MRHSASGVLLESHHNANKCEERPARLSDVPLEGGGGRAVTGIGVWAFGAAAFDEGFLPSSATADSVYV